MKNLASKLPETMEQKIDRLQSELDSSRRLAERQRLYHEIQIREFARTTRALENKLKTSSILLENAADGIVIANADGYILTSSQSCEKILGYTQNHLVKTHINNIFQTSFCESNFERNDFKSGFLQFVNKLPAQQAEIIGIHRDHRLVPLEITYSLASLPDGIRHICIFRDITQRKIIENKLAFQATHDFLSGLPNRFLLMDRLQQSLLLAERYKNMTAVLFLDLDYFKSVNDTFGHKIGDHLLKQIVDRICGVLRKSDTFARLGGDEFVIVLPSIERESYCITMIKRIFKTLKKPFLVDGNRILTSISIGISIYPQCGTGAAELLANADSAMYQAKQLGRSAFKFHSHA